MSQGSFNQKNRFLGQNVRLVARSQTHRMTTDGTLSGFQDFYLHPIVKDRPNMYKVKMICTACIRASILQPTRIKYKHAHCTHTFNFLPPRLMYCNTACIYLTF